MSLIRQKSCNQLPNLRKKYTKYKTVEEKQREKFVNLFIELFIPKNIFIELLIPKTSPIMVGIIYKPPDQLTFPETLSDSLSTLNILNEECYILGDLNINLSKNGTLLRENNKNIVKGTNKISTLEKKYFEFWNTFEFKQIIQSPTGVTQSTSSLIHHILINTNEKIAQFGQISDRLPYFQKTKTKKKKNKKKG